jgi:putative hydrolase of the HAD superfamily
VNARADLPDPSVVDAVLFDAGGVLLLPDARVGQTAVRSIGCESALDDWHLAFHRGNLFLDQAEVLDWLDVRRAIATSLGVGEDRLDEAVLLIEKLIAETPWTPVNGAAEVLGSLSAAGYQLGVVSNASGTVEEDLAALAICSVLGGAMPQVGIVVDSHHVGIEKPDPRIFHIALDALGIAPSRAIYVGDTVRFDVLGAEAAGMHPVHMDPFDLCRGEHAHIGCLADLAEWCVAI